MTVEKVGKKDIVIQFLSKKKEDASVAVAITRDRLIALLSQITSVDQEKITSQTKLSKLQIDSLLRIELLASIEDVFRVALDETEITAETTVVELREMIAAEKPIKSLPPLRRWPRWAIIFWIRPIGQFFTFLIMKLFVRLRIEGLEHLENIDHPVVFMPNHVSYLDALVLVAAIPKKIRKRLAFAAANDMLYRDYWYLVFLAEFFFNTFPFPRKEKENIKLGLDYMGRLLDKNCSIAIFPEGAMSVDAKLLPLKRGAGLIAIEMHASIIPVKLEGTEIVLPYAKMIPRKRATVTVKFGKPLNFEPNDSYIKATEIIEKALRDL